MSDFGAERWAPSELRIAGLSLMKYSEGGMRWEVFIDLDLDEVDEFMESVEELERRIEAASKRK